MAEIILSAKQKQTLAKEESRLVAARAGVGGGSGVDREFRVGGCKLLTLGMAG